MSSEPTDAELLRRYVAEGAEDAFAALADRHVGLVFSAAFRQINDEGAAQEISQNVFIALARRAVWLTGHPSLAGWLYRTAVHLAHHELRARQRREMRELTAIELGAPMSPDDSPLSELSPVLDEALLELGEAEREALVLRYFANKSIREVGAALGVREDAAQKRIAKALKSLTERFRKRGFRVGAAATTVLVLQKATAALPPPGLGALATHAALSSGAGASLGGFAWPLIKLMSLTKVQTAALCCIIAVVPLGYEWQAGNRARAETDRLSEQLKLYRGDALSRERDQANAEQRTAELDRKLAGPPTVARIDATPASGAQQASLFVWDDTSDFVRLPKSVLSKVKFAPFRTKMARDGKLERFQAPPLGADGTPEAALEAALGLSPAEADRFREICRTAFADFQSLAAQHSEVKEEPFLDGARVSVKIGTFPDEGSALRDTFRAQLSALLGADRMNAFEQQAASVFDNSLNGFGAYPHEYSLSNRPNVGLEILEHDRVGARIGTLADWTGTLPPNLQAYADMWTRQNNAANGANPPSPTNP